MTHDKRVSGGKVHIWMNLIGFDRDDDDKGAERFIEQTGFVPDGVCALLFHPDFVHHHKGMGSEYTLYPDNCSYNAVPRNAERERQPWTNYDLRELCKNLDKKGCGLYAGIMGCTTNSMFHKEWIEDYPELYSHYRGGVKANHCILKRFSDGTYYEDFFIDKLCEVLTDYGMKGVHFSDCFCPGGGCISYGDFSTDMINQFMDMTGCVPDEDILSSLGDDSAKTEDTRAVWIWKYLRREWIEFMCARWERFFKKLCDRVHAVGCEVMVLGMYCTDPFETKYCMGMDLSKLAAAGVDYITENILPSGCYVQTTTNGEGRDYRFQRYMAIAPMMAAHVRDAHLLTMLGTYDATEEWDILHHVPCMHELDIYTSMAYRIETDKGSQRALEGYFVCLGDGISHNDWMLEHERFESAMSADVERTLSPVMLWSDHSFDNFLDEYISTRRWTPFKFFYELGNAGTMLGGCIRSEDLGSYSGPVVVADFDMLSEEEQKAVVSYRKGSVLAFMKADYDADKLMPDDALLFVDKFSNHPQKAYLLNVVPDEGILAHTLKLVDEDDGILDYDGYLPDMEDFANPMDDTLPFVKVSRGFVNAMAYILRSVTSDMVVSDVPCLSYKLKNGNIRLYLFNTIRDRYSRAFVNMKCSVADTKIVSKFPILPARYKDSATGGIVHNYETEAVCKQSFEIKLAPGGVAVADVILGG